MQPLLDYLANLPVELFVLCGAFIEELISPIPSFLIFVPAGASVEAHGDSVWYILVLAVIAAVARVPAAIILYWLSVWTGSFIFSKKAGFLGVSRRDVEQFRTRLGHKKSWWALFVMWSIPLVPGAPISLASGFIKLPLSIFITATFFGSIINALVYLYIGYFGLKTVLAFQAIEFVSRVVGALLIVAGLIWIVLQLWRRQAQPQPKKQKISSTRRKIT